MKISTKGRYALRVMIDLAEHNTGEYIPLMDIARRQDISEKYLEAIVATLSKNEFLISLRGKGGGLSSYTARHTWATTAYYCEIHPGIISEAMGHSSITVTETYLKPFRNKKIDEANREVVDFVKRTVSGLIA